LSSTQHLLVYISNEYHGKITLLSILTITRVLQYLKWIIIGSDRWPKTK